MPTSDGDVPIHDARCRDECISMLTNQEPDGNIDALTDTEIYTAIHYLEPDPRNAPEQDPDDDDEVFHGANSLTQRPAKEKVFCFI